MRKVFRDYYHKRTNDDLADIWSKAYFVLDTNVLLELFLWTEETRSSWLAFFGKVGSKRLWMPYQVAREYHEHVDQQIFQHHLNRKQQFEKALLTASPPEFGQLNNMEYFFSKAPKEFFKPHLEKWKEKDKEWRPALKKEIADLREQYLSDCEKLIEAIALVFNGQVGEKYSIEKLRELDSAAALRIRNRVPPGFEDAGKENQNANGDVFIWLELLERTKKEGKPLIFITNDHKIDWCIKPFREKKELMPRPELVDEMRSFTGQEFLLYGALDFIKQAKEYLQINVSAESLKEIQNMDAMASALWTASEIGTINFEISRAINLIRATEAEIARLKHAGHVNDRNEVSNALLIEQAKLINLNSKRRELDEKIRAYQIEQLRAFRAAHQGLDESDEEPEFPEDVEP